MIATIERMKTNNEIFKRWDKIRTRMSVDEIVIGVIKGDGHCENGHYDELSIMKNHSGNENYFAWFVYDSSNDKYEFFDGNPDFRGLIEMTAHIEWKYDLLENLEMLFDL